MASAKSRPFEEGTDAMDSAEECEVYVKFH